MRTKVYLDEGTKGFLILLLISQLFFTNGLILFVGLALFYILFYNLQQPLKPSVFTITLIYHFLQISAGVWQSNNLGNDINYRSDSTDYAILSSYVGLLFIFLPIIYYQNKIPKLSLSQLKKHADRISIDKTFKAYVVGFVAMNALTGIAFLVPSLTQIIFSLGNIKWFLFLLFGFQSILKNRKRKEFYIFCALEFVMGFYSYFSDFKTIIFFIAILLLSLLTIIKINKMLIAFVTLILLFFAGVFWTSIKGEYRLFLNKGSKTQSVQVEKADALNKLIELSENQNASTFTGATENFLDRLQYTYHLAKTMDRVPKVIPYQYGANLGSTLAFVFTPRVLNPNKGVYDASVRASKYTGIQYAGIKKGVSVSLGYFADGYIDFGYIGMYIPLLILGFIYGKSYFYFIKKSSNNYIFNFAVVGAIYLELFAFESDSIFLIGRLYVNLLIFFLLKIFFFPKIMAYIQMPLKKIEA
ncbi:MAG: hypothetical protein ABL929_04665 [Ferruginibacter sp.]|nr:hypothetical protein [Ferruginibacter sp.]